MAEKTKTQKSAQGSTERIYIIPIRENIRGVPRYRKTEKAIKVIKKFLVKHMKVYDRDLKKIKVDNYLNEFMWARGIKNPPYKVKVKVTKGLNGIVNVGLVDYPNKLKFKKIREERLEKASEEMVKKKKERKTTEEAKAEESKTPEEKIEEAENKKEEEEKKAAVVESGKKLEKEAAKQMKRQTKVKSKEPKHLFRQALQK